MTRNRRSMIWAPFLLGVLVLFATPAWAQKSLPGNPAEPVRAETLDYLTGLCEGCHGAGGVSQRDDVPSLAGRPAKALFTEIERFYFYERLCPDVPVDADDAAKGHMSMCDITSEISRAEATALSEYFAAQPKP